MRWSADSRVVEITFQENQNIMSRDRKNDIHYIINLNYLSAWCPMEMFSAADYFSLELGNISVYILIVIPF